MTQTAENPQRRKGEKRPASELEPGTAGAIHAGRSKRRHQQKTSSAKDVINKRRHQQKTSSKRDIIMTWVRIDDGFFGNPKIVFVGRDARDLYLAAICYANKYLTDGFVPAMMLPRLAAEAEIPDFTACIPRLTATAPGFSFALWSEVEGGYQIHDYLEYQPSREKAESIRQARAEAGSKGGRSKAEHQASSKTLANDIANNIASDVANPVAKHLANGKQNPAPSHPIPHQNVDEEQDPPVAPPSGGAPPREKPGKQPVPVVPGTGPNCVALFIDRFRAKFGGEDPDIPPRRAKELKARLAQLGPNRYERCLDGFFADAWASESGHNVVTFLSQPVDRWLRAQPRASPAARNGQTVTPPGQSALMNLSARRADRFRHIEEGLSPPSHGPPANRRDVPLLTEEVGGIEGTGAIAGTGGDDRET